MDPTQTEWNSKTLSVLIAEASSGVRPMMTQALRELGFEKVTSVDSLEEALNMMATDHTDWLITSMFPQEKVNALQVLKLGRQDQRLGHLKVSVFASQEELDFVAHAFELGLLSSHAKPFTKDTFRAEIEKVVNVIADAKGNTTLASAHFLREHLKARDAYKELLEFEQV